MKRSSGFTLVELLVSLAIIGIMASVALALLGGARSKSRDGERISDIRSLRTALELYKNDTGSYPDTLAPLAPNYIPEIPTPPSGTAQTAYRYARYGTYPNVTFYHMGAVLENLNAALRSANCRSGTNTSGSPPRCVTGVDATASGFNGLRDSCTNGGGAINLCYDITPSL